MTSYVYTETHLRERTRLVFCGGLLLGVGVGISALVLAGMLDRGDPALSAPEILRRDADVTVAKIPSRVGDRPITCTLTIDHKHRSWSMAC